LSITNSSPVGCAKRLRRLNHGRGKGLFRFSIQFHPLLQTRAMSSGKSINLRGGRYRIDKRISLFDRLTHRLAAHPATIRIAAGPPLSSPPAAQVRLSAMFRLFANGAVFINHDIGLMDIRRSRKPRA